MKLEIHSTSQLTDFGEPTEVLDPVPTDDPDFPGLPKRYVYVVTNEAEIKDILAHSLVKDTGLMTAGEVVFWMETSQGWVLWFFPFRT